jgi:dTDP-4-amino-4,6-dideoxygalactose transaminase
MNPVILQREKAIPMLDLAAQYRSIESEIKAAIHQVLESQHFILGPQVAALEEEVAEYCGTRFGAGVASGTDALILALSALGIGPGDEVLVPSFSFIATADSVSLLRATPVFVDIDPETFCIDVAQLEAKITDRTRAIIPVHLYGQAVDMDPILDIARRYNLVVIEDNAQAIGAAYKGKKTGSMGDIGCISFFPSKNLGAYGDGGMIVTNSEEVYRRVRSLRAHGAPKKYFSVEQGWNSRLDELQAGILRVKLRYLDTWSEGRRSRADLYDRLFATVPEVKTPKRTGWGNHVFHQYTVCVQKRDAIGKALLERGVPSMVYYPVPIHLQPMYASLAYNAGDLPGCEKASAEVLSLPIYPELTNEQIEYIVRMLAEVVRT